VTALAAGDVNHRDGLIDILVGVVGDSGPRALVFEGKRGALNAEPEVFDLADAANSFAIGQFDNDPAVDIAIAAGHSLLLIYGHDRKLIADTPPLAEVKQATTSRRDFSFNVKAITSGKFSDGPGLLSDIGLLADDGAIYVLRVKDQKPSRKAKKRAPQWAVEKLSMMAQANAARLSTARVSSLPTDNMLLLDAGGHQVRIIETGTATSGAALASHYTTVDLDVEGVAIAALPMRLNADALDDLVILRRGESAPTILTSMTQKASGMCHPIETRPLTVAECKRIQQFPDDWYVSGTVAQQYRQIGNAVPPLLAKVMMTSVLAAATDPRRRRRARAAA